MLVSPLLLPLCHLLGHHLHFLKLLWLKECGHLVSAHLILLWLYTVCVCFWRALITLVGLGKRRQVLLKNKFRIFQIIMSKAFQL